MLEMRVSLGYRAYSCKGGSLVGVRLMEYDDNIVPMDISPDIQCYGCGDNRWGMCVVNTNPQYDYGFQKPLPFWYGRSVCLNCLLTIRWEIDPDILYPPSAPDNNAPNAG